MLKQTSRNFRAFFVLQFTRQLIKHSGGGIFELENVLKEKHEETRDRVKQLIKHTEKQEIIPSSENKINVPKPVARPMKRTSLPLLRIPEPRLPMRFQYLKPTPTKIQIDLGKLNPLVKDPMVRIIECNGPDESVVVKGTMGTRTTSIILNKQEVDGVIKKFSEVGKIPLDNGVFRVVAGGLILLAIISEMVDSKFIIKKMGYAPLPRR